MEIFKEIVTICGGVTTVGVLILALIRPLREKFLGLGDIREGVKCQLRSDMLRTYYHRKDAGEIRQYELENFLYLYEAYKALGGNSFIDHIKNEVDEFEVVT